MNYGAWIYPFTIAAIIGLVVLVVASIMDQFRQDRQRTRRMKQSDYVALPSATMRRIRAAGIQAPALFFHVFAFVLATLIALLVMEFFRETMIAGFIALLVALYAIYSIVFEIGRVRASRYEARLVDAIDIMASSMKGSTNPRQALESAATVVPRPVGPELKEVINRLDVGMDIRRALLRMQSNYDSEGVRMFCSTLTAKWSTGGDLSPTLISLNKLIRERLRHRLRLKSRMAGAQISTVLVAISPYFIVVALMYYHPVWLQRLIAHQLGPTLLFTAVCCQIVGFLWLRRMMRWEM